MKSVVSRFVLGLVLAIAVLAIVGCGQPSAPSINSAAVTPPAPPAAPANEEAVPAESAPAVDSPSRAEVAAAAEPRPNEGGGGGSEANTQTSSEATAETAAGEGEVQTAAVEVPPGERLPEPFPRRFD